MKYLLLKSADKLMSKIQIWVREYRDQLNLLADYRPHQEVRLVTQSRVALQDVEASPGCTLSIRQNALIIACSETCFELERKIASFLQRQKLIGAGNPLNQAIPFQCKNIRHDHVVGRRVSEQTKAKHKERRELAIKERAASKFKSVFEASIAAEAEAGMWLIMTQRALETASHSIYLDPDYVHQALMDLAYAAKYNADHQGLGMPWTDFLGQLRSHNFVPNTSPNTIERYRNDYFINYNGESLCIQAHIRKGTGTLKDCLRIYVVQPRKPGDPIIIGQIGSHLPTATRSH